MSPVLVWFKDDAYHQLEPPNLEINWDPFNLTMNKDAKVNCKLNFICFSNFVVHWRHHQISNKLNSKVDISLWGYKESTIEPQLIYITTLQSGVTNKGMLDIIPEEFYNRDDGPDARSCRMGMIMINLTNPVTEVGMSNSPMIWSRPMPLGWYLHGQWKRFMGSNYIEAMCDQFIKEDREWKNFAYDNKGKRTE